MRSIALALLVWFLLPTAPARAKDVEIYVSPTGRDTNPGTKAAPLATPHKAQELVRKHIAGAGKGSITVFLAPGRYMLPKPLTLTAADSGTAKHSVTWSAAGGAKAPAVLSGGRTIGGWRESTGGVWTTTIPEVKAGTWHFRQLFVNDRRATRARWPNADAKEYCVRLKGATLTKDLKTHTLQFAPGQVKAWRGLEDTEVVVLKNWATLHKKLQAVDAKTGLVTLRPPHVRYFSGNRPRKGCGAFFENSIDFLDAPGEWYLDRATGVLSYRPRQGEDMSEADVVAPRLTHVLEVKGEPGKPMRGLRFYGLSFQHTHLPLPPEGHHGRQAAWRYGGRAMPQSVRCRDLEGGVFHNCEAAHLGGSGIALLDGCRRCTISHCRVWDVEGNGIDLAGPNKPDTVPQNNRIADCTVTRCGQVYYGAVGIWAGFAQRTVIEHNLVHDLPYTGISIGWRWNASPTVAREYFVRNNHVHDVMKQVCDGGALYSLGFAPGTIVEGNLFHDVHRSRYAIAAPNNGFFLDQGSKGYVIRRNVMYHTAGKCIRHNQNKHEWHTWEGNVLLEKGKPTAEQLKRVAGAGVR